MFRPPTQTVFVHRLRRRFLCRKDIGMIAPDQLCKRFLLRFFLWEHVSLSNLAFRLLNPGLRISLAIEDLRQVLTSHSDGHVISVRIGFSLLESTPFPITSLEILHNPWIDQSNFKAHTT
jgi:hypothetical protein